MTDGKAKGCISQSSILAANRTAATFQRSVVLVYPVEASAWYVQRLTPL